MSELTQCIGGTFEFKHHDKVFHVTVLTEAIKAQIEKALFAKARQAAVETKDLMTRSEYVTYLKELNDSFISGDYAFAGQLSLNYLGTYDGSIFFASLLFGATKEEMVTIFNEQKDEVTSLIALIVKETYGIKDEDIKTSETLAPPVE